MRGPVATPDDTDARFSLLDLPPETSQHILEIALKDFSELYLVCRLCRDWCDRYIKMSKLLLHKAMHENTRVPSRAMPYLNLLTNATLKEKNGDKLKTRVFIKKHVYIDVKISGHWCSPTENFVMVQVEINEKTASFFVIHGVHPGFASILASKKFFETAKTGDVERIKLEMLAVTNPIRSMWNQMVQDVFVEDRDAFFSCYRDLLQAPIFNAVGYKYVYYVLFFAHQCCVSGGYLMDYENARDFPLPQMFEFNWENF